MKKLFLQLDASPSTPCKMECDPLNTNHCLISTGPESEAVVALLDAGVASETVMKVSQSICRLVADNNELARENELLSEDSRFWKLVANQISTDQDSGLITGNALGIVSNALFESGMTERYRTAGFKLRIVYADIDELKKHNSGPGQHTQGDLAIKAVAMAIGKAFVRKTDIKLLDANEDHSIDAEEPHSLVSRSNAKGDEFVVFSFFDPADPNRNGPSTALDFLQDTFSGLSYEYDGVVYPVNISFGVADIEIPTDPNELAAAVKQIDSGMMVVKERPDKELGSMGGIIEL